MIFLNDLSATLYSEFHTLRIFSLAHLKLFGVEGPSPSVDLWSFVGFMIMRSHNFELRSHFALRQPKASANGNVKS